MSIEIIEKPKHKCEACGCVFSFDKDDFCTEKLNINSKQISAGHFRDTILHSIFVACPICDSMHIIKEMKKDKDVWV